ncbi:MAG: hypothetical protein M5U25_21135 [Planctomycetota bacterium]|nr:hypothetical protein [Planctomycetota bacterium]
MAIRTFLESVRTRVAAVVDGSAVPVFTRVWIAPFLNLDQVVQVPRWPAAIIVDKGGEYDLYNGKIMTRRFSVSIMDCHPRDHVGEETSLQILDRGEYLMTAMEYDTDIQIYNAGDDDLEAIALESGLMILLKTYNFTAQYLRT